MEDRIVFARKDYFRIPNEVVKFFKLKDLYLVAGLYNSVNYSKGRDKCYTDITIEQLSKLTGVSQEYISKSFLPRFKRSHFGKCTTKQVSFKEKRNQYELPYPNENYRIMWKQLFSDGLLSPEEKGFIMGLYCLCYNNSFRLGLSDTAIIKELNLSPKTYRKYRDSLLDKKVICSSMEAPIQLVWSEHMEARILLYPCLGYKTYMDEVRANPATEKERKEFFELIGEDEHTCILNNLFMAVGSRSLYI